MIPVARFPTFRELLPVRSWAPLLSLIRRGSTLRFDGSDDYVTFGDRDEMDSPDRFTVSLWFKREQDLSDRPTNHAVDNVLIAQSSSNSNDNFEIGTDGSFVEVYADSGTAATDATVRVDAGITDGVWHHLALSYGSEMILYVDGTKVSTWTQYNGRLSSLVGFLRFLWESHERVATIGVNSVGSCKMFEFTTSSFRPMRLKSFPVKAPSKALRPELSLPRPWSEPFPPFRLPRAMPLWGMS